MLDHQKSAGARPDLVDVDMAIESDAEIEVVATANPMSQKKKKKKVPKEGRSAAPRASTSGSRK